MKRLLLALFVCHFAGCDVKLEPPPEPEATPAPAPKAAATPKPGEWLMKDYKNPLDSKPTKQSR
jgi:hypothetical protein